MSNQNIHFSSPRFALLALPFALIGAGNAVAVPTVCTESDYSAVTTCYLPPGVTQVKIEAWGGGGGGSLGDSTQTGGGGGGGSYCGATFSLAEGTTLTIAPGPGGAAGSGLTGGAGTSSLVSGTGVSGLQANGGGGGTSSGGGAGGTTGGCTATSATAFPGGNGSSGTSINNGVSAWGGGGGGGAADYNGNGSWASGSTGGGGRNGNIGAGGQGGTVNASMPPLGFSRPGMTPGGGGGGGNSLVAAPNASPGAAGKVKLTFLVPVTGGCGTAHATTPPVLVAPSGGALCSTGTASSVTTSAGAYTWTCAGANGGADSGTCSATRGYTVTPSAGANGSISPNTPQVVAYNATPSFTATPGASYAVNAWAGSCGGTASSTGNVSYTTSAVTADCGVSVSFVVADSTPDAFGFSALSNAALSTLQTSDTITVAGINTGAAISITGGEYQIGSGSFVSAGGTVNNNDTVTVRHTSSAAHSTATTTTLTIGTVSADFVSTTLAAPVVNGACGSAHASTPLVTSAPSTNLCTTGTAGSVTSGTSAFTWVCAGSGGGNPSGTCSATRGYTVTPSAGANGSISPSTPQVVAYNATTNFTVTPSSGYQASASGCRGSLSGSTYTTGAITEACSVSASFGVQQSYSAPSPTGSGNISTTVSGGGGECGFASSSYQLAANAGGTPPAGVTFPHGVLNFTTNTCATGGTLNVTITYPQALPTGTKFYKYGPATAGATTFTWYEHPATISQDRLSVSYSVTDGGQGDSSATPGVITDPAGPAAPAASAAGVTSVPTLSEWGVIIMSGLMMLFGIAQVRRRQSTGL